MRFIDKTGNRFGRLLVVRLEGHQSKHITWLCRCDCGNTTIVSGNHLANGHTQSCGCFEKERTFQGRHVTHGAFSGGTESRTHNSWRLMLARCYDPKNNSFPDYGGRGVTVCDRWKTFENFVEDMAECPPGKTIDRENNAGNYSKENCRWATKLQQANNTRRNRRILVNGETKTLAQWSRDSGINAMTIKNRLNAGWSPERSVQQSPRQFSKVEQRTLL